MKKQLNIDCSVLRNGKITKKECELGKQAFNTVQYLVIKLLEQNVSKESIKTMVEMGLDSGLEVTQDEIMEKVMELHGLLNKGRK